jgi:hypothetical protein
MLYASLLNRRPSPTGLASYTSYIRNRGLSWTIGHMMSSRAYRDRLKAICAGHKSTAASYVTPKEAVEQAVTIYNGSRDLAIACGVEVGSGVLAPITVLAKAPWIIAATAAAVDKAYAESGGTSCKAALQAYRAANKLVTLAEWQGRNNAVFIEYTHRTYITIGRYCDDHFRIGRYPITPYFTDYHLNYRC